MAKKKKKQKKKLSGEAWREARALMWAHRRTLSIGVVLMVVSRGAGMVMPASSKYLIDEVIGKGRAGLLVPLSLAVAAATVVQGITSFQLGRMISVSAQRAITDMRRRVMARVTRLPIGFFDSTKTGVLVSRVMTDAEGIRNLVGTGIVQLAGGIFTGALALVALFWLSWKLTFVVLFLLSILGGMTALAFTRMRPIFRERGALTARVVGRLTETMGGIRVVKAYGTEKGEQRVFTRGSHRLFRTVVSSINLSSGLASASGVVTGAISVMLMLVGGRAILDQSMTLGDLIAYMAFTALLAAPVVQVASVGTQVSDALAGLDRIREVMRMETEDEEDEDRDQLHAIHGHLRLEGVGFEYVPGQPVLTGIDVDAPPGTTTALVGSSGSGKSTLVSLVMAFNRPTVGRVTVDGKDLESVRLADYRSHLGVVLQENFLFDGTVADNIRLARPGASRAEVEEVARIANVHDFVEAFPDGYDTIVGERGIKLSGGQRQRVAIARAILADPRILILDEATSSLDSESEALIQEGLRRLREGRTTFVIAHRLSTIRSADQILVLEEGVVVERGTHAELMARRGRYRVLHDRQYALESDRFINPGEDFTPEPELVVPKIKLATN